MTSGRIWPVVGGTRLSVHPAFVGLLAVAVAVGLGREAALLCAVLVGHEVAHLFAARAFRLEVSALQFLPFGGLLRIEGLDLVDPGVEAAIALFGPVHNLLWLAAGFGMEAVGWLRPETGGFFLAANALIGAGNLLPALPLDGGRIAVSMLSTHRGRAAAERWSAHVARWLAAALAAGGGLLLWRGVFAPGLFVFAGFLLLRPAAQDGGLVRGWREMAARGAEVARAGMLPVQALAVAPATRLRAIVGSLLPRRYHLVWVVEPHGHAAGPWDEAALWNALRESGAAATAADLTRGPEA